MFLHLACLLSDIFNKLLLLSRECPAGCGSYALIEMVNSFSVSPELRQGQSTPHTFCSMLERVRVERREISLLKIVQIISTTTCQQYYLILPLSLPPSICSHTSGQNVWLLRLFTDIFNIQSSSISA